MAPLFKRLFVACVVAGSVAFGTAARSADDPAPAEPQRMTVVYVGEGKISVKPGNGKDKSVKSTKYKITDDTKITINGEAGELAAIKPGHKVVIVAKEGEPEVAASITLTKSGGK